MSYNKIENDFDVSQLTHQNICVWPIVKSYLITLEPQKKEILKKTSFKLIWNLTRNLILDIFSLPKVFKSKIWVFTNSERRYAINDSHFDRVTSGLLKYTSNYILFENPIPKGRSNKKQLQKGEFLIGMSFIYLIQFILIKITKTPEIASIKELEKYLDIDLDKIKKIYHRYHTSYQFYNFIFKFKKPNYVFLVCYYSNFGLIKACKKNKIPIIELQHGIITKQHRAYNFTKNYGSIFLPDYFLSYGVYFSEIIKETNFVSESHILNYGYSFIHEANKKLKKSDFINKLTGKFKKIICITGQLEHTDTKLLAIIDSISEKFEEICFIYKPRHANNNISFLDKKNFIKLDNINTYELIKFCDYHITIYSTCALESIALGTPNISVDIDNLYSTHLEGILGSNPYNFVVKDNFTLDNLLKKLEVSDYNRNDVSQSIEKIFSTMISTDSFSNFFKKIKE